MADLLGPLLEHSSAVSAQGHAEGMRLLASQAAGNKHVLDVVAASVTQAQASNSDDAGLIAALQTASRAPIQGANDLAK